MSDGWTWILSERAAEGLATLDEETQQRVLDKLDAVSNDEFREPPDFAKPLSGAKPWQSLRIGDYRAIVRFDSQRKEMKVGAIGHRSTIYDELP